MPVFLRRIRMRLWNKCVIFFSRHKIPKFLCQSCPILTLLIVIIVPLRNYTGMLLMEQPKGSTVTEDTTRMEIQQEIQEVHFNPVDVPERSVVYKDNSSFLKTEKTQAHRKAHVEEACSKMSQKLGKIGEITGYRDGGISYCIVQKAGCTSWLRIFRFLNGEKTMKKTPFHISKYETHNSRMHYFKFFSLKKEQDKTFIEKSQRVMTVRDPWARLWSAYIDKFLLPDFWTTKGKEIIKRVRKNATIHALRCGSDVTFKEFIAYVVLTNGKAFSWGQDKHWIPSASMCDPCQWKPKYISKQETLSYDLKYILTRMNLEWVLNGTTNIDRTAFEMRDQTNYVFGIHHRHKKCATKLQFCELMWAAYKLNGYIPMSAPFPKDELKNPDEETFLGLLNDVRKNWKITKEEKRRIKRKALVDAFKTVPAEHLKRLQDIYSNDFYFFEYEKEPKDIFS